MASVKRSRRPQTIVVVSDTHCGCQVGLCTKEARLDSGGIYTANAVQKKLLGLWEELWGEVVPGWTAGGGLAVVHNGDAVDGTPHGSISQISANRDVQNRIAMDLLRPVVALADGRYFHVRGTESHVAKSAEAEEELARALGAVPSREGNHARWELWMRAGPHLVHFTHHIGTASRQAYESSAVMAELAEAFVEAGRWGVESPSAIVRSHRHRQIEIRVPTARGNGLAVVTPAWQAKTPFAYRIAGARQTLPQFGAICLQWNPTDGLFARSKVWTLDRPQEEVFHG